MIGEAGGVLVGGVVGVWRFVGSGEVWGGLAVALVTGGGIFGSVVVGGVGVIVGDVVGIEVGGIVGGTVGVGGAVSVEFVGGGAV